MGICIIFKNSVKSNSKFGLGGDILELNNLRILPREFYERETLDVAKDLLDKYLIHNINGHVLVAKIIETEAYKEKDKAAHFNGGKRTERTDIAFGEGGFSYVYLIYGMYYCFNVVTEVKHIPGAVLIRKLEPVLGIEEMMTNRKIFDAKKIKNLCDGPGKLCISMNITKQQNKVDLTNSNLYIVESIEKVKHEIKTGKRINIDYAGEDANLLWRFYL